MVSSSSSSSSSAMELEQYAVTSNKQYEAHAHSRDLLGSVNGPPYKALSFRKSSAGGCNLLI
eukprot:5908685-Ditylum_brightwellii.AAC.1